MSAARPAPSRFGLAVAALSLALALATAAVVLRGDQSDPAPVAVAPADGAGGVSTGASLHVRFARPMEARTVDERLRLDPPVDGSLQWAGSTLTFTPGRPLQPATDYTATLAPGLAERQGRVSRQPYAWRFRTRAPLVVTRRVENGVANLWLLDPAGGPARPLTRESVDVLDFSVAPDGERVAYSRQDAAASSLWIVHVPSGATSRLSPEEDAAFTAPAWSPRGDLIVFERRQLLARGVGNPKLFAARADGTPGGLIHGRGDEVGHGARWSPDGARLAFFNGLNRQVLVFNFTRELVPIPVTAATFDWSPDGRRLVVEESGAEDNRPRHRLLIADAGTGATRPLAAEAGAHDTLPRWSPDGARIAFIRRPATAPAGSAQPWVVDAEGGEARPVAGAPLAPLDTFELGWSPHGRWLLLNRQPPGAPRAQAQLWLLDLAAASLPRTLGEGIMAAWLP